MAPLNEEPYEDGRQVLAIDLIASEKSTAALQEEARIRDEIWVPEPDGKLCSTMIFRWGLQLQVEGTADHVNAVLDAAVEANEQADFVNPYFGTRVIVRHPDEVMVVNTDWADLEQIKLSQERVKAAKIEERKAALAETPRQGFRKSR